MRKITNKDNVEVFNDIEYTFNECGHCTESDCDIYSDLGYNSDECRRCSCAPFEREDQKDGNFKVKENG